MKIKVETFKPCTATVEEVGNFYTTKINGKVDVEVDKRGTIINCWANKAESGIIYVFGFMGKYATSSKLWRSFLYSSKNGAGEEITSGYFGRDDRCGRFNKLSGMFFEPKTFFDI